MRKLHFLIGLLGVLVFLFTGAYMNITFPGSYEGNEVIRYMYRANHVYLLMASLVNLAISYYLYYSYLGWRRTCVHIGSILLYLSPFVLTYAFFFEAPLAIPERNYTFLGVVLLVVGMVLHLPNIRINPKS